MDEVCHRSHGKSSTKPASIQGNQRCHQTATCGSHVLSTRRQSMPSSSIESCARLSCTVPLSAFGQMNRPRSSRLATGTDHRHPTTGSFTMSPLTSLTSAKHEHVSGEGLLLQYGLHLAAESIEAASHIRHPGRNPDLRSSGKLDHWRKLSSTARTREPSAPLSTLINARPGSSIWIAPALDPEVSPRCSTTSLFNSLGAATVTGSNAAQDSINSPRSNSRRHLNTWFAFKPCTLATSASNT